MSNIKFGKWGEDEACNFLIKKKYKIIEKNYKFSRYGEIDIIALDKDELCFIEVKTRSSNKFGIAMEAITKDKLSKILLSATNYMSHTQIKFKRYRIDAISVELIENDKPKITHIKNIEF